MYEILALLCTFLAGITAGAWLNGLANEPQRSQPKRR